MTRQHMSGYTRDEPVEAFSDGKWLTGTITDFDPSDEDQPFLVRVVGEPERWYAAADVRKPVAPPEATRMELRRVTGDTLFTTRESAWEPLVVTEHGPTNVSVPANRLTTRIEIRRVPVRTEAEMVTKLRELLRQRPGQLGNDAQKILKGEF